MLIIRAGIYKIQIRIANREGLQKQSDLGLRCFFYVCKILENQTDMDKSFQDYS